MAFEVYKPRGEKMEKIPLVSLSKNSIVLNKTSREKLQTENVELAYDRETKTIRIKAVAEGQVIRKTKLFARGFFKHFGINEKGKFPAEYNAEESALYVKLE